MCQGGNGVPISQPPALEQEGSTRGALGVGVGAVGDWGGGGAYPRACWHAARGAAAAPGCIYGQHPAASAPPGSAAPPAPEGPPNGRRLGGEGGGEGDQSRWEPRVWGQPPRVGSARVGSHALGPPPHTQTHFGDLPPHSLSPHRHLAAPLTTRGGQHQRDPPLLGGVLTPLHSPRVGAAVPPQRTPLSAERSNGATKRSAMEPEGEGGGG